MKKYILYSSLCCLLVGTFINQAAAQTMTDADLKAQMTADWQRAKIYTQEYMNTMPADKYGFKAVDSLRSFAQQLLHLASGNVFLMSNGTDQTPLPGLSFALENRVSAQSKDSVVYFVNASYDFCINAIKNSDPTKWKEEKEVFGSKNTKYAYMQKAFEHQTHHRGQTTIYIRENNIRPPQEKLF